MGICHIAIIKKGIEYGCISFVVSGNGPVLLEMPDSVWKKLLTEIPDKR